MKKISEITKRDILELFQNGIESVYWLSEERVIYPYYGRLSEIVFLKRLYKLEELPSFDSRFENAMDDIYQHTENNDDYESCWIFEDNRFELMNGSDEIYLNFICEVFNPAVRIENKWKDYFDKINSLLKNDGYELYMFKKISNRDVYSWRLVSNQDEGLFVPYTQRNRTAIKSKKIKISIDTRGRLQILGVLTNFDYFCHNTNETGWNTTTLFSQETMEAIKLFYTPKYLNEKKEYIATDDFKKFVCYGSSYCVLDIIEYFYKYNKEKDIEFEKQINQILRLNNITVKLMNGIISSSTNQKIKKNVLENIREKGLEELLKEADEYYDKGELNIAVEKLWDALERLKSYYYPILDKKKSIEKIISFLSNGEASYKELFDKEFKELTTIGNEFRIRHHEKKAIEIIDTQYYIYFYKRCYSLISLSLEYLNKK